MTRFSKKLNSLSLKDKLEILSLLDFKESYKKQQKQKLNKEKEGLK